MYLWGKNGVRRETTELNFGFKQQKEKARKVASQLLANSQHNESFYKTIITSSQWNDWVKLQEYEIEFDVHESIECGVISNNHWQAFLEFIKTT